MKLFKRTLSILLALLMLATVIPVSVYAATLKITTQPKTSYTEYGETAKATIKATGDGLKYTWYVKNAGASKYSKSSITKSTYSVKMTDSVKGRTVYCVVKDKKGKTVKSSTAILRMKATITTEPKTTYAKQGDTAKLTVKAKGDGLKYTWYIKNAGKTKYSKSSVTKSTYSVTMSDKVHGRYVYCVVTDKYGKTDKSKTVVLRQQATITTQPKTTSAALGEKATVSLKAKGDGLKYTWYIKNAGKTTYSKSSVTTATYSTTMSEKAAGRYLYCVVTDKYGKTEKSKTVMLKLKADPLTITMQPETVTCKVGDEVGFSVVVKGGTAPYTYRWEYILSVEDGWLAVPEEAIFTIGDMVSAVVPVEQSDFDFNFRVRCVITDAKGAQVTTNEAGLIQAFDELAFNVPPQTVTASVGDEVSFYPIVEGGKLPYTYQWQIKGALGTEYVNLEEGQYQGVTEDYFHFVVNDVEFDNGNTYRVIVTDANGTQLISDPVWVEKAIDPLTITYQPESTTASAGDEVGFGIVVTGGVAPYTYQLKRTNFTLEGAWEDVDAEALSMGNMTTLLFRISSKSFLLQDRFCIVVTDAEGNEVTSNVVWVEEYVSEADPLTIVTQPQNVTAKVDDTVSFSVAVSGGTEPYAYRWQYMADDFTWTDIIGWTDGRKATLTFVVDSQEFVRDYRYRCVITDAEGNEVITEAAWVLEAKEPLALLIDPVDVYAEVGDTVSFTVGVFGGTAPYTYHWQYMANNFSWTDVSGWTNGTDATLSFDVGSNEFTRGYQYRCVITDANGETLTTNAVSVKPKMFIVTQPRGGYAAVGEEISTFVEVDGGKGPYTYQWQYWTGSKWLNLTGETNNRLSLTMDQGIIANEYHYRCVITDATDTMLFTEDVQFKEAMRIWIQPANTVKEIGSIATFQVAVTGGAEPYTYQWQFIRDGLSEWRNVGAWATGGTGHTMSFLVEGSSEWNYHHQYRCVITDAAGNQIISDAAWVVDANALRITSQPVNDYGRHGQQCTFIVQVAGGTGPYTYQWQWSDYSQPWRDITNNEFYSGAKTNILDVIVMEVDFDYETKYRCIITDAEGNQVITNAVWAVDY